MGGARPGSRPDLRQHPPAGRDRRHRLRTAQNRAITQGSLPPAAVTLAAQGPHLQLRQPTPRATGDGQDRARRPYDRLGPDRQTAVRVLPRKLRSGGVRGTRLTTDARRIVSAQAARALAYGLGSVLIGVTLAHRGLSAAAVGAALAALLAGSALASVLLARYGDRVGRRRSYRLLFAAVAAAGPGFR